MCKCEFNVIKFNSTKQYLEYMKIQNRRLREKNGIAKPEKEFMANHEWIRKNRIFYSFAGSFYNLRDI